MALDAIYARIAAVADAPRDDAPNPAILFARVVDLLSGKVSGKLGGRTGPSGRWFVTAKMRVSVGDGDVLFANVIPCDENAKTSIAGAR